MAQQPLSDEQSKLNQLAKSWLRLVDCISHDLTTPLAVLRMNSQNIEKNLSHLLEGYNLAIEHNLLNQEISEKHLQGIKDRAIPTFVKTIAKMQEFLDILHPLNQQLLPASPEIIRLSVKSSVETALKKYPFSNDQEKALVHTNFPYDFTMSCAPIFVECLFENLLRNAFYAISKSGKGEINIWTEEEESYNTVHFKDSSSGINEKSLPQVFQRFFSKRENTIVPGLGFCRLAVLQTGGEILCDSVFGEYTDFIIKFPKV